MGYGRVFRVRGWTPQTFGRLMRVVGRNVEAPTPQTFGRLMRVRGRTVVSTGYGRLTGVRGRAVDFTIEARPGADTAIGLSVVQLTGVAISGPAVSTWTWEQRSGPAVVLTATNDLATTFRVPAVVTSTPLVFRLTAVSTAGDTATDDVTITVIPHAGLWQRIGSDTIGRALN